MIELQLLNAIIAKRDSTVLERHRLADPAKWHTQRPAYEYVTQYVSRFGEMPSIETVIAEVAGFDQVEVVESVDVLARRMVDRNSKADVRALLTSVASDFGSSDGHQLVERLRSGVECISVNNGSQLVGGTDWATTGAERYAEHEKRERGEYGTALPLLFPVLTDAVGGTMRGDYVGIMAATSRGKTWLGQVQALACHHIGERVLFESGEMAAPTIGFRFDTLESGITNRGLYTGKLAPTDKSAYHDFTSQFYRGNGKMPLIVKTSENWPNGLTIGQLEADIKETAATVVIIDQFNLMRAKSSSTEDKTLLSRQIKQMANRLGVLVVMLCQTNGDYLRKNPAGSGDDGIRELKLPTLADYSETIAIQQDADIFIGFDAVTFLDGATGKASGKALIGVLKGRNGGAGSEIEVLWCPDHGIITPKTATDLF